MKIPGLSLSWKRALSVSKMKRDFTKATGIPTTRNGIERKTGNAIINLIQGTPCLYGIFGLLGYFIKTLVTWLDWRRRYMPGVWGR